MSITLDPSLSQRISTNMNVGGGIQLPFNTIYPFWYNGDKRNQRMAQNSPAEYFGGWVFEGAQLDALCQTETRNVPAGLYRDTFTARDGTSFPAYFGRHLLLATIGTRTAWRENDNGKMSSKTQVLSYLAEKVESQIVPWGSVVLTASGWQTKELQNALKSWDNKLKPALKLFAPGVPSWFFYMSLGTFGDQRQEKMVGPVGSQSPIVPIQAYVPATIDEATLTRLFVGEDIAAVLAGLSDEAQEWLHAWDKKEGDQRNGNGNGAEDHFFIPRDMGNDDDQIPF